jgi:hypothetical protein
MRLFFAGFLMTGLVLIGYSIHERRQSVSRGTGAGTVITSEDGTGFPSPNPTPKPKTR